MDRDRKRRASELEQMRANAAARVEQIRRARRWAGDHSAMVRPAAWCLAMIAAGGVLYAHRVSIVVAGLLAVSAALVAHLVASQRCADRMRVWLVGAIGATGAWLTAATMLWPLSGSMLLSAVGGTAVFGVGLDRTRRSDGRPGTTTTGPADYAALWAEHANRLGAPGSRVVAQDRDELGVTLIVEVAQGGDGASLINTEALRRIESVFGLRRASVSGETVEESTRRARIRIMTVDPHAEPLIWTARRIRSVRDGLVVGTYADGTDIVLWLYSSRGGRHILIGGASGSGKSSLINELLVEFTGCDDVLVIGADLKDGQELDPWRDALPLVVDNPTDVVAVLVALNAVLKARAKTAGGRQWIPEPGRPAIVLIIDECSELWRTPGAITAAESIIRRGRSLGVHLVLATQYPLKESLGSRTIRSQCSIRFAFKMQEAGQSNVILQDLKGVVDAKDLPDRGGYCYAETPEAKRSMRGRAVYVPDDVIDDEIATIAAAGFPEVDDATMAILGPLFARLMDRDDDEQDDQPAWPVSRRGRDDDEDLPPLPETLRSVPLSAVTGVDVADDEPDSVEKVARDQELALRLIGEAGPGGVRILTVLRKTGRPSSTVYDWLYQWQAEGRVIRVEKGFYALSAGVPAATGS